MLEPGTEGEEDGVVEGEEDGVAEGEEVVATAAAGLDRASATTLLFPAICLMSEVYSARYDKWRCTLADHASEILCSA